MTQRRLSLWLPPLVVALVIFCLSTDLGSEQNTHGTLFRLLTTVWPGIGGLSPEIAGTIEFWVRKCAHVTVYFWLGSFVFRASRGTWPEVGGAFGRALLLVVLYAASDEYHQSFVPTRTSSIVDVGFDTLGGVLGMGAYGLWAMLRGRKPSSRRLTPEPNEA
ncbi:MAG TPA: VanZ family protein [Armatimonadota bacterium]